MNYNELSKLLNSTRKKPFTMPCIFGKEYAENFISDWLCYILDPELNGVGYEPLNTLLKLAGTSEIDRDVEYVDLEKAREHTFDDGSRSRIDFLIPVFDRETEELRYYIAIENKIHSTEGENQTEKYYKKVEKLTGKPNSKNIYIFLYVSGQEAENRYFKNVRYENLIKGFKAIPVSFDDDPRRTFLFQEFITHIEEYILSDDLQLPDNSFELLKNGRKIKAAFGADKDNPILKKAYEECMNIKGHIYNMIYKQLSEKLSENGGWTVYKSKRNVYIQIFKESWEKHKIHYEIILEGEKNCLYDGCDLLLMIHYEGKDKQIVAAMKNSLGKFDDVQFSKRNWAYYEEKIKTLGCFENNEMVKDFVNGLVDKTERLIEITAAKIDEIVAEKQ